MATRALAEASHLATSLRRDICKDLGLIKGSTTMTATFVAQATPAGALNYIHPWREGKSCDLTSLRGGRRRFSPSTGLWRTTAKKLGPTSSGPEVRWRSVSPGAVVATLAPAPPEIAEDEDALPTDLLSALESPRFMGDYGEGVAAIVESPKDGSPPSDFRWDRHWYAVHALDHIDPAVPHAVTVLGRPMVLWRDASENWRCFLDECPHRRVPLSEGRIDEKGRLACSYHAWSFNGDGNCACIPQASEGPEARAVNNPRSRCVSFPLKESLGVLFVWPDETSPDVAETVPLPLPPGQDDPSLRFRLHVRDLPYSYEFMAENFMDPAHLPVAHHNIGPLNLNQAQPILLRLQRFDRSGFEGHAETSTFRGGKLDVKHTFPTPALFSYDRYSVREGGKPMHTVVTTYMTPSSPGSCRVIVTEGFDTAFYESPQNRVTRALGFKHLFTMDLLDSDAVFLHYQEVAMRAKAANGNGDWRDAYFLPTRADLYVTTFRKWLERFAHGGVKYGPGWDLHRAPGGTREQLMDRANGHVAHCKYCTGVLANYRKARVVFVAMAAACMLLLGGVLGSGLAGGSAPAGTVAVLLVLAGLSGGAVVLCSNIIQKFVYTGWDHGRMP